MNGILHYCVIITLNNNMIIIPTKLLVVALFATCAFAQIPSFGFCPDYIPMTNFDVNRFLGRWYEVERYFTVSEVASRCVTTEYSKGPSGRIYVSNEITNRLTGIKRVVDGTLDMTGPTGEGKMSIKYNSFPPFDSQYAILDTDYDSVAIIWSCNGIGPVHTQNAWVMTRDRTPTASAMQRAYGVLDKYKISRTFFLKTDQKDCSLGGAFELLSAPTTEAPQKPEEEEDDIEQQIKKNKKELNIFPVADHILKQTNVDTDKTAVKEDTPIKSEQASIDDK